MKKVLAALLGERLDGYDASKYRLYGDGSDDGRDDGTATADPPPRGPAGPPQPAAPPQTRALPPPLPLDDDDDPSGMGAPDPAQLGCWIMPQTAKVPTGGNQQLVWDRSATAAKTQIAAVEAPTGRGSTLAAYEEKTWRTPFEVSQDVVSTGALINTYTGEVSEVYEDCIPPPDRTGGDPEREWKNASLRLQAAQGYELRKLQKREIEDPLPPADSGPIMTNASFRQMQAVTLEGDERCARDKYFNRDELVPTEPQMTTNPMGYRGFQNMIRINPYLPVTQDLDTKDWTSNCDAIPTTARFLETRIRLHRDALAGRTGLAESPLDDEHIRPTVRRAETQRNNQNRRTAVAEPGGTAVAPCAATTESICRSLRGTLGDRASCGSVRGGEPLYAAPHAAGASETITGKRTEERPCSAPLGQTAASDLVAAASLSGTQSLKAHSSGRGSRGADPRSATGTSFDAGSAWGTTTASTCSKRDKATTRQRPRPEAAVCAPRPLVATAEECRRSVLYGAAAPSFASAEGPRAQSAALAQEATLKAHNHNSFSMLAGGSDAHVQGPGVSVGESSHGDTRRGFGEARSDGLEPASAGGAPSGAKVMSDKRGLAPLARTAAAGRVTDHQVRRAPFPVEGKPREPERERGAAMGRADNISSGRAFLLGEGSRKERPRGPTPRKGGAERNRSGLVRLDGPTTYEDE